MKYFVKTYIAVGMVCFVMIASTPMAAKQPAQQQEPQPGVRVVNAQTLEAPDVAARIGSLVKADKGMAALAAYLERNGYQPMTDKANHFGVKVVYAGQATGKQAGEHTATITVVLQDYLHKDGKQQAAIAMASGASGSDSGKYGFILFIAPGSDIEKAVEYRVDDNLNVVRANSWFDCISPALFGRCSSACLVSARLACRSPFASIARLFNCAFQAAGCAGCMFGPVACCTCNCGFFCAWATGCCRHT